MCDTKTLLKHAFVYLLLSGVEFFGRKERCEVQRLEQKEFEMIELSVKYVYIVCHFIVEHVGVCLGQTFVRKVHGQR